jgi:hypothetical protein
MSSYFVVWSVHVDAENAVDAAEQALAMQRDPDSNRTAFSVYDDNAERVIVDLFDEYSGGKKFE